MVTYFDYFPKTIYKDKVVTDITKKVSLIDHAKKDITLLKPYVVNDGEKPEDIAYYYYGTINHYWVILMVNDIVNYYEDWVMDEDTFTKYMIVKYKEQSGNKNGYDVVAWTMDQTILDNILYYHDESGNVISKDTVIIDHVPSYEWHHRNTISGQKYLVQTYLNTAIGVTPFRIYDYEYLNNEQKRNILLIDNEYVNRVVAEFTNKIGD